jgi:malonyl-CoA/methylmalonyl-CoA synthetase
MTGNVFERLRGGFPADRSKPCFLLPDGDAISYGAVEVRTGQLAHLLIDRGVVSGDRIVAQATKSPEMIMLYFATLQVGAVFVPLNTAYTSAEVDYFVNDAEPRLFVDDPVALMREAEHLSEMTGSMARSPDDLAAIVYTSGTTGRSKGAMLSHGNLAANAAALHEAWGFTPDDVLLHALPIFHIHGLFIALHCALLSGAPMLWLPGYDDAAVLASLPRATVMMGVPTFYTRLLGHPDFTREAAAHMRLFISGSAPLLTSTFDQFEAHTGQRILERYGMSEAIIITTNPLNGERKAGSVGFPLPGVDLRIAGDGDNGPIEIRGPSVLAGYWRAPEKTAESFTADGYFITGDVGRIDEDGRLWISGREKDLIISGGLNIYPREIEGRLDECDGIVESAVIGVPHPDLGEGVVAVVIGAGDEKAIIAGLRAELAGFKMPKRLFFVDDFPRNAMGKIQKNVLREMYGGTFSGGG